jgi:cytochrome oxidase Cu insertion factor (SCO1/SenC/PrrC family)
MAKQTAGQEEVVVEFDAAKYIKEAGSKSAAIRKLTAEGKTRSEIAKMLGVIYQHVRNVQITPIKKQK